MSSRTRQPLAAHRAHDTARSATSTLVARAPATHPGSLRSTIMACCRKLQRQNSQAGSGLGNKAHLIQNLLPGGRLDELDKIAGSGWFPRLVREEMQYACVRILALIDCR